MITSLPFPIVKESLFEQITDLVQKIILSNNGKFVFQQVNNNYSFNLNLGDVWKNHENAYVDVIIGDNVSLYYRDCNVCNNR